MRVAAITRRQRPMNIQQLEPFYWITRLGTFAAAGEYLHTSQANVSSRIRELESELDVLLFERIGRTVTLTLKGRELLAHAERVVAEAARLRVAAGKLVVGQGLVRIGVGEERMGVWTAALLPAARARFDGSPGPPATAV